MFPFVDIFPLVLESFISLLLNPIFWAVVVLVGFLYKRMDSVPRQLFNIPAESLGPRIIMAALFGLVGGVIGSYLLILVGISVTEIGISYLWITALLLMLIEQRFLCFAYAGGVLSISSLILGFPKVSVAQIMGLVAILHMVEALLIYLNGPLKPIPVYLRNSQGRVVGGYNLQKFWPMPIIVLLAWNIPGGEIAQDVVKMPDWWPLIKAQFLQGEGETMYMMMPVIAALGYGDIAMTTTPKEKTKKAALELGIYSIILLLLSIMASNLPLLAFIPALFGPLGHELLIRIGQRREMQGESLYVAPSRGVKVFYVLEKSPLKDTGVMEGDIITAVNGEIVLDKGHLNFLLLDGVGSVEIEYFSQKEEVIKRTIIKHKIGEGLGFIAAPQGREYNYIEIRFSSSMLKRWWKKLRKKE